MDQYHMATSCWTLSKKNYIYFCIFNLYYRFCGSTIEFFILKCSLSHYCYKQLVNFCLLRSGAVVEVWLNSLLCLLSLLSHGLAFCCPSLTISRDTHLTNGCGGWQQLMDYARACLAIGRALLLIPSCSRVYRVAA